MTAPAISKPISPPSLVRLAAPAVAGVSAQKGRIPLPAEMIICPWGLSQDLQGNDVIVNETTLNELAANQSRYGFAEIALDFGHNTAPKKDADGNPLPPQEPQLIASLGALSVREGTGIVFSPRYWTPEGETFYTGRHYPDLSPTVGKNDRGEVTFVHSAALTRAGQIENLHAFSAAGLPTLTHLQSPAIMDNTTDYKALLLKKLNLPETASDEEIVAAADAPPPVSSMAAPEPPAVVALAARVDLMERNSLVSAATQAGKVINLSAESIAAMPLTALAELVEKTPVTVPLAATAAPGVTLPQLQALSAEEKVVAARFGYTEEKWRELNPV